MTELVDVVVIGGGIAGKIAAIECAKLALSVRVLHDASGDTAIRSRAIGSVDGVDTAAESFLQGDAIDALCTEFGLETEVLLPRNTLLARAGECVSMPTNTVAGIPANPFASDLSGLARSARWRAYADRVMPFLKVGEARNLAELVRVRMGTAMLETITRPLVRAQYRIEPERVDINRVAPKLNRTLTTTGTLSGAVLALSAEEPVALRVRDGLARLDQALADRLEHYAVELSAVRATGVERTENGWTVHSAGEPVRARAVIAAVDPESIGESRPSALSATARSVRIATMLIRASRVPRATGILAIDDDSLESAALLSARSPSLRAPLDSEEHLLRLVVPTGHDTAPALARVADWLGLGQVSVLDADEHDWTLLRPWVATDDPTPAQFSGDCSEHIAWTGQWASGSGLARVATHAIDVAHQVRRSVLEQRAAGGS
ncbi:MAG: protoporphyrinogen/coproporphyrinogen oxidase [Agromyces sp.]